MLWFQPVPWVRWLLALLIASVAVYVEFRPDDSVEAPFATTLIAPGDPIDETNTELRKVPSDLLDSASRGTVATRSVLPGSPVMAGDVGERGGTVPTGWWVVGVTLPHGATVGDDVRLVLLDSGLEVSGVVAHPGSDDPFAAADGGVAVPPESSADVAMASAEGRLAVLISTN
jgi:hypothetical protein